MTTRKKTENLSTEELCSACADLQEHLEDDHLLTRLVVAAEEGDIASVQEMALEIAMFAQAIVGECEHIEKNADARRQMALDLKGRQ